MNDVIEHLDSQLIHLLFSALKKKLKQSGKFFISYPPWESPYASHLKEITKIPWIQFFPDAFVQNILKKRNKQLVGTKDLAEEYNTLNHMNHKMAVKIINANGLKISYRYSHSILRRFPLLKLLPHFLFLKYLITKEFLILEKNG